MHNNEDASVYKLNESLALVQSVDFMAPITNSAYHFGAIAAANALSDIYAMGARVINALNIVCFDECNFSLDILQEIQEGANDKVRESGALVLGGHSVSGQDFYYGLSVSGLVHPKDFWQNNTAKRGDLLILTKPIGSGILSLALKAGMLKGVAFDEYLEELMKLNLNASKVARLFAPSAVSDLSGFGLIGHALEMCSDKLGLKIKKDEIRALRGVTSALDMGLIPAAAYNNKNYFASKVSGLDDSFTSKDILYFDPQSSGGLLIAIEEKRAFSLLKALQDEGCKAFVFASFESGLDKKIMLY